MPSRNTDCLQKIGEANRFNADTFNSLAQTNSHMTNNIAADVKKLQTQMQQLLPAGAGFTAESVL